LRKYRFGVIILKGSNNIKNIPIRYSTKAKLEKNYYNFYKTINNYDCYVSNVGYPPYYLGQSVMDKYHITGNFKSGCGSTGVYMIRDKKLKRLVLKVANSNLTYQRELLALNKTKDWKHSPTLVDSDNKRLFIITDWCGRDFKKKSKGDRISIKNNIQQLTDTLLSKYHIYHNDVRWKNITQDDNSTLVLIDWGMSSDQNREKNHDKILCDNKTNKTNK
jgi:hypothetical protein